MCGDVWVLPHFLLRLGKLIVARRGNKGRMGTRTLPSRTYVSRLRKLGKGEEWYLLRASTME